MTEEKKRTRAKIDLPGRKKYLLALLDFVADQKGIPRSRLVVQLIERELLKQGLLDPNTLDPTVPIKDGKVAPMSSLGMKPLF